MTPDIVVDIGNSRMKWGRVRENQIVDDVSLPLQSKSDWNNQLGKWRIEGDVAWSIASVNANALNAFRDWVTAKPPSNLTSITHKDIPIHIDVKSPDRVGIDRLLNAYSAWNSVSQSEFVITIAIGTAMTVDATTADGRFLGGAILPGPWLMAQSLQTGTNQLPRIEPAPPSTPAKSIGKSTEEAILYGIQASIYGAADVLIWNIIREFQCHPFVFITGGGIHFLPGIYHASDSVQDVSYEPRLTLEGIRLVAERLG